MPEESDSRRLSGDVTGRDPTWHVATAMFEKHLGFFSQGVAEADASRNLAGLDLNRVRPSSGLPPAGFEAILLCPPLRGRLSLGDDLGRSVAGATASRPRRHRDAGAQGRCLLCGEGGI